LLKILFNKLADIVREEQDTRSIRRREINMFCFLFIDSNWFNNL